MFATSHTELVHLRHNLQQPTQWVFPPRYCCRYRRYRSVFPAKVFPGTVGKPLLLLAVFDVKFQEFVRHQGANLPGTVLSAVIPVREAGQQPSKSCGYYDKTIGKLTLSVVKYVHRKLLGWRRWFVR